MPPFPEGRTESGECMQDLVEKLQLRRWAESVTASFGTAVRRCRPSSASRSKILYLHVAKAGGSSFNLFLQDNFNGESHCERYIETQEGPDGRQRRHLGNLDHLRSLDYISGHLTYPILEGSELDLNDYLLVTILRHPFAQTISHMNWVIKISEDPEGVLFKSSRPDVQQMSLKLRAVEGWSPDTVVCWLEQYPNWFKNNQARYFVSPDRLSDNAILDVLHRLDLVGVTERIDAFVSKFRNMARLRGRAGTKPVPHENRNSSYQVPLSVLDDPRLQRFLAEYNRFDMAMYTHAESVLAP